MTRRTVIPKPARLAYISKKADFENLVNHKILFVGDSGKLLSKDQAEAGEPDRDIFSLLNVDVQDGAVVRWVVQIPGDTESRTWRDVTLWDSWADYYFSSKQERGICLVAGQSQLLTTNHPKYILHRG